MATVNLGFENNLWEMADKLRGNIEASEYKHVVLGLIFLKYISDAFEERYNELVAEGEGFEEDIDAYTEVNVFYVPKEAISKYGKPEIINSDQGSQFTSKAYIDCIKAQETIKISMDGKGRATDNIMIERFFRSYKWERLYLLRPETVKEAKAMTKEYIQHYNYVRDHQGLDNVTPYSIYRNQQKVAA
jgi:hypothetical protein